MLTEVTDFFWVDIESIKAVYEERYEGSDSLVIEFSYPAADDNKYLRFTGKAEIKAIKEGFSRITKES